MTDTREMLRAARDRFEPPPDVLEALHRRRERRDRVRRRTTVAVSLTLFLGLVAGLAISVRTAGRPAGEPQPTGTVDPSPNDGVSILPPSVGHFSEVGGWIAFHRDGAGLWVVAPDGSEETTTLDDRSLWALDWSPDGSRLLVDHGGRLAVIEPDGSETTLVLDDTINFDSASFSPDGATILYARWARGGQLLTVASDGSGKPRLLSQGTAVYRATYSPDGARIAYEGGGGDHSHTISVVNADGTDVRVLIDATPPFDEAGHITGIEWSPDGSLIAVGLEGRGIYTIRPDGTGLRLLIPGAGYPAWSPDGSLIAYSPYSADLNHDGVWGVWVANADGSDPQMLSPGGYAGPWNPGGPPDRA
jgi:Tol biopolymer transport system component